MSNNHTLPITTQPERIFLTDAPIAAFGESQRRMTDLIHEMNPGELMLNTARFGGLKDAEKITGVFTEDKRFSEDRPLGLHKLFFGRLILSSIDDYELPTQIAVKPQGGGASPFKQSELSLSHEWSANNHVAKLTGYQSTFLPLGVWKSEQGVAQLITQFEEPVKTFDRIFWETDTNKKSAITVEQMTKALVLGAAALGVLHGAGLVHGEPHPGNLARDSSDYVRFADLESLKKLYEENGEVVNDKNNRALISGDFEKLVSTLTNFSKPGDDIYEKILGILSDEHAVDFIVAHYYPGIRFGRERSGVELPEKLAPRPERLARIFSRELDRHKSYKKAN